MTVRFGPSQVLLRYLTFLINLFIPCVGKEWGGLVCYMSILISSLDNDYRIATVNNSPFVTTVEQTP